MLNKVSESEQTNNGVIEKYCSGNTLSNCTSDGGLYQWAEAIIYLNGATNSTDWSPVPTGNVQGLCPSGWHIPSDTEWYALSTYLTNHGHSGSEGTALKAAPTAWNGTDDYGFTALPSGDFAFGSDHFRGDATTFWSSSPSGYGTEIRTRHLFTSDHGVAGGTLLDRDYGPRDGAYSIRCLAD